MAQAGVEVASKSSPGEFNMTSSLSTFPALRPQAVQAQLVSVGDVIAADTAGTEADLHWARSQGDGNDSGPSATRAGRFVGLLLCAASSALVIWLVTFLF
jgi:hypothetical protein